MYGEDQAIDATANAGANAVAGTELDDRTITFDRVAGYVLHERIGEGGMGIVHRAVDRDGRSVAVKLLRPHVAADAESRARFAREARVLSQVTGPHIAEVLDADVVSETPYLVTRFVQGTPLLDVVRQEGPLTGGDLADLAGDLADALGSIHAAGIVHRDLKPANVLLESTDEGRVAIVIDFGIAQLADETRMTMTGLVYGTPGYVAPEVMTGRTITQAADIHAWASTVTFAATGHPPFGTGPFEAVAYRVLQNEPSLESVPAWLAPVVVRCFDKRPECRPTAQELLRWLETGEVPPDHAPTTSIVYPDAETLPVARPLGNGGEDPTALVARQAYAPPAVGLGSLGGPGGPGSPGTAPMPQPRLLTPTTHAPGSQGSPGRAAAAAGQGAAQPVTWRGGGRARGERTARAGGEDWPRRWQPAEDAAAARAGVRAIVVLCAFAIAVAAANAPLIAAAIGAFWLVGARTIDRATRFVRGRRTASGPRRGDGMLTAVTLPWHAGVAAVCTALTAPIAVGGAAIVTGLTGLVAYASGNRVRIEVLIAVCAFTCVAFAWWGFDGASLRRGTHRAFGVILVNRALVAVGVLVLLAVIGLLGYRAGVDRAHWWPIGEYVSRQLAHLERFVSLR